jgi:pyruvate dehydrogenase E1 component beta subunit
VSAVTAAALEHARGQPTDRPRAVVIEAVGCRVTDSAAASSSRLEQYLRSTGALDAADLDAIESDARARVAEAVDEALTRRSAPPAETPTTARTADGATDAAVVAEAAETPTGDTGAAHTRSLTPRQAIHAELRAALQASNDYVLFGSTVDASDRTRREIDALASAVGRDRVLSLPVGTATLVDCAVGATTGGIRPVVTAGGSPAAVAAAVDSVTPARRSADAALPPVTIRVPTHSVRPRDASAVCSSLVRTGSALRNGTAADEPADADTAATRDAGPVVLAPSTAADAADLFAAALHDPRPAVVFDPPAADHARTIVPRDREPVALEGGSSRVVRRGDDVTAFTAGAATRPTLRAAEALAESGTDCTVVDLHTLAPLDCETIRETFRRTGRAVVVQPASLAEGLASEITAFLQAESLLYQEAPVVGVTPTSDEWASDEQSSHSESARTQLVRDIERGIREAVEFRP